MKQHENYDPDNPAKLYSDEKAYVWANKKVEEKIDKVCGEDPLPQLVALDGTGVCSIRRGTWYNQPLCDYYPFNIIDLRNSLPEITSAYQQSQASRFYDCSIARGRIT